MMNNNNANEEEYTSHNYGLTIGDTNLQEKSKNYKEVISENQKQVGEIATFNPPMDVPF